MKAILTLGIVLVLLMTVAHLDVTGQVDVEVSDAELHEKNVEICLQNLIKIGKSIQAYMKEHNDYPKWLSSLHHPKYLPDPGVLICPADTVGGKALYPPNVDPHMPISYGYRNPSDYKERVRENRSMYGDVVPFVRCRHHANQEFHCLNLNYAFQVSRSFSIWEAYPEQLYETPEKTATVLEAGLQQQPYSERLSKYVYPALTRLYISIGREENAANLIDHFKSVMNREHNPDYFALAQMLEMMDRHEELLQIFEEFEQKYPNDRSILRKLAEIHQKLGNVELAAEYRKKAEPALALIGKPMPDFLATDLDGNPISLQQYRGKVVLLDFWAVWCGPCIAEMPNIKKVYNTYKDEGFDIIGISLDTDEAKLRDYLKENELPWRQVFSGEGWRSPIARQFGINAIPAPWLIARDGTLLSTRARGHALEPLVVDALKE